MEEQKQNIVPNSEQDQSRPKKDSGKELPPINLFDYSKNDEINGTLLSPNTRSHSFSNFYVKEKANAPIPPSTPSLYPRKSQQQRKEIIKQKTSFVSLLKQDKSQCSDSEILIAHDLKINPPCPPPPVSSDTGHPKVRRFRGKLSENSDNEKPNENQAPNNKETNNLSNNSQAQNNSTKNLAKQQNLLNQAEKQEKSSDPDTRTVNSDSNFQNQNEISTSIPNTEQNQINSQKIPLQNDTDNNDTENFQNNEHVQDENDISEKEATKKLKIDTTVVGTLRIQGNNSFEILRDLSPKPPSSKSASDSDGSGNESTNSPPKRKPRTKLKKKVPSKDDLLESDEKTPKKKKIKIIKSAISEEDHNNEDLLARISIREAELQKERSSERIEKLESVITELKLENTELQNENSLLNRVLAKSRKRFEDLLKNSPSLTTEIRRRENAEAKLEEAYLTIAELQTNLQSKENELETYRAIKRKPIQQQQLATQSTEVVCKTVPNSEEIISQKIEENKDFNLLDIIDKDEQISNELKNIIDSHADDYCSDDSYSYSDSDDEINYGHVSGLLDKFVAERDNFSFLVDKERKRRILLRQKVDELTELLNASERNEIERRTAESRLSQTHERLSVVEQQIKRLQKENDALRFYVDSRTTFSANSQVIKLLREIFHLKAENRKLRPRKPLYVPPQRTKQERQQQEEVVVIFGDQRNIKKVPPIE